jgi:glycosyltransferase involved in cell wall biosynthesis
MQRPVVCQLLHTLHVGGAEVLAGRLARRLQDEVQFVFICLDELGTLGQQLRDEGFPVEVVGRRPGLDWRCSWRLSRLLRQYCVQAVHAHQYTPFFYTLSSRLLCSGIPILFTEHGRHQPDYPRRKRMVVNRLLLGRRDRVVGVGEAVRQALIVNEGFPARRVDVVYNGIDEKAFNGAGLDREVIRAELGLEVDDLVILQVARLDYLKDHGTAIRTIARVAARMSRTRLVLVGEGPEGPAVRAQVEQLGLGENVQFLGLRQDVARLLQAADLFLLTSISEGIPLTLIEAMCAGLPVVSTLVGGTGEVVVEGQTGFLAPARDDRALADAVVRLGIDPDLRRRMGEQGRERAKALFSEARMAERYLGLYKEMLRG